MKVYYLLIIFIFSCQKKDSKLELTISNHELMTYKQGAEKDTINYVTLKLENKTDKIYYFNASDYKIRFKEAIITRGNYFTRVYKNLHNEEVNYSYNSYGSHLKDEKNYFNTLIYNKLGYKDELARHKLIGKDFSFYIHPNEVLYFEYPIRLTSNLDYEGKGPFYAEIKDNQKYYANVSIFSDSTEYKKFLPRDVIKTIEANNVEVYHGIIESNKIPVRVLE